MHSFPKKWLAILCLCTAAAFFGQTMLCFAGDLGVAACVTADHHDDAPASSHSEPASSGHCCHCSSHIPIWGFESPALSRHLGDGRALLDRADLAPDGPVREIDYPPQLS